MGFDVRYINYNLSRYGQRPLWWKSSAHHWRTYNFAPTGIVHLQAGFGKAAWQLNMEAVLAGTPLRTSQPGVKVYDLYYSSRMGWRLWSEQSVRMLARRAWNAEVR
jgi:hypothetical protein